MSAFDDNIVTADEFANLKLQRYKEMSTEFRKHLDTVPAECREAVVGDYLDQLVKHGWIKKEFRDQLRYNIEFSNSKYSDDIPEYARLAMGLRITNKGD